MTSRTLQQHRDAIEALLAPLTHDRATEQLGVSSSLLTATPDLYRGRILAHDLVSPSDLPPFDNSQMDGYAVRATDLQDATPDAPARLVVAAQINAGDPVAALDSGAAAPIMTGAPLPEGADTVVPIERASPDSFPPPIDAQFLGSGSTGAKTRETREVSFNSAPERDEFVRRRGSDVGAGDTLLAAGTVLGPAQLGVIAGTGLTEVDVLRRIRVLLISTGHEIREAGTTLEPGQIYDSNSVLLGQALIESGCTVVARPCRSDDAIDLLHVIERAEAMADLVITVGGVSAGAREVVRDALGPLGVQFVSVAMQPGGPQGLGRVTIAGHARGIPVITFPGNPVSALVSFEMFVRPVLRRLAGLAHPTRETRRLPLVKAVDSPLNKHQVRRGAVDERGLVHLVGGPSSHLLHSYATSSVLVHLPEGVGRVETGELVEIWRIDD